MVKMVSALIISIVWYFYFYHFNHWDYFFDFLDKSKWIGFSDDKADWGTFGDFIGGVLNPILSFITIVMLINSLKLQREANQQIISGEERQKDDALLKRFEDSFYNLISSEREEFKGFYLIVDGNRYESSDAVAKFEVALFNFIYDKKLSDQYCSVDDVDAFISDLDNDSGLSLFSMVRCVYVVFKLINEKCPSEHRGYYTDIFMNMMPVRLVSLVSIASIYMSWANVRYINSHGDGFLNNDGVQQLIDNWKLLHLYCPIDTQ